MEDLIDRNELDYLSQSPRGSKNYWLSTLPVTFRGHPQGKPLLLPPVDGCDRTVVVVPIASTPDGTTQHHGRWDCVVIQSNDSRYHVGGLNCSVSNAEIRRGRQVTLNFKHEENQ